VSVLRNIASYTEKVAIDQTPTKQKGEPHVNQDIAPKEPIKEI